MSGWLVHNMLSDLDEGDIFLRLIDWFGLKFVGGPFSDIDAIVTEEAHAEPPDFIIRSGEGFGPLKQSAESPTISFFRNAGGNSSALASSSFIVFASATVESGYPEGADEGRRRSAIIPEPVDFRTFSVGSPQGLQQYLALPDGSVCWIGDMAQFPKFHPIVRQNSDTPFVAVFLDQQPDYGPPNLRMYSKVKHDELSGIIGACRVGLCTGGLGIHGARMGACGLPLVATSDGIYRDRNEIPGKVCDPNNVGPIVAALREVRSQDWKREDVSNYWRKDFSEEVVLAGWEKVIKEAQG